MNCKNYLRFLLVAKSSESKTFNRSLIKLIQVTLYESKDYSLSIDSIRIYIQKNYSLEFTNDEILKAIRNKRSDVNEVIEKKVVTHKNKSYTDKKKSYNLDKRRVAIFRKNEEQNPYSGIIKQYLTECKYVNTSVRAIEIILNKFFYYVFNSNINTLLLLLKNRKSDQFSKITTELTEDEKIIVNSFLNWDNKKKNVLIFELLSYCVDYCMLTIKKDYSTFRNLFEGKSFYLDANIIFRMAGVNNEERRAVTNSFIKKSKASGIRIKYTNFTYKEICDTVKTKVDLIKHSTNGHKMLSLKHYKEFLHPYTNLDFYRLYHNWCKEDGNNYNDYSSFYKYIMKLINDILSNFEKVDFIDFNTNDKFDDLSESLKNYKKRKNANFTRNSIAIDINNYMYIFKLRDRVKGSTLLDIPDYFITADSNLCEWGKRILPGVIPIAILPSVWHSLLLKFTGRTQDDYKAFTLFLNLRYKIKSDNFDERKPQILSLVQTLDEPVEIKEMILSDISENLTSVYNDLSDVNEIIEKSKNSIINKEAEKIYKTKIQPIIDTSKVEGKIEAFYKIAGAKAKKKYKILKFLPRLLNIARLITGILLIIGLIVLLTFNGLDFISKIFQLDSSGISFYSWITLVLLILQALSWLCRPAFSKLSNIDYRELKNKEYAKIVEQYDN